VLPLIVFAQFAGTSLWFAGNAVLPELQQALHLGERAVGHITSAVQLGFIAGTLVFAVLSIADRFSPSKVFLWCALLGAFFNLSGWLMGAGFGGWLAGRFLTGFFLAGVYPVGMKISADWYDRGLGKALGWLVGALVLGTAFPHLLRGWSATWPWTSILLGTSTLAATGGVLLYLFVGDGPHRRPSPPFRWDAVGRVFRYPEFRAAAFGYFGHMWELYAFWAFVPVALSAYDALPGSQMGAGLWSFAVIGAGSLGCIFGGYGALRFGSGRVAFGMLACSGLCCLLAPLLFQLPEAAFLGGMLLWGFAVVGDSPQFSTIVAKTAPPDLVGTALTIVNCIGFALTILSIQLLNALSPLFPLETLLPLLALGPALGLAALRRVLAF